MRILLITNASTPYKRPVWDLLAENNELTVAFEMKKTKERNASWESQHQNKYREIYMHSVISRTSDALCLDVIRLIIRYRKDLIVIEGYSTPSGMLAIMFCKMFRIPYVVVCDGAMIKPEKKFAYWIKRMLLSQCHGALSSGNTTKKWLMHYGVPESRIRFYPFTSVYEKDVLQNNLTIEEKQSFRNALGLPTDLPIVVAVGRFIKLKNYDKLLLAWKNISHSGYLLLIGEGEERVVYERIISECSIQNVRIIDFVPSAVLRKYYKAADVFVHTSNTEAWGLVFNEAMSCGLPCIGTDKCVGALDLIEQNQNGLIIPADSVESISDAIDQILAAPLVRARMGHCALQKIREYTIEKSAQLQEEAMKHFDCLAKK